MLFVLQVLAIIALLIPIIGFYRLDLAIGLAFLFEILVPAYFDLSVIGIPLPYRFIYAILFLVALIFPMVFKKQYSFSFTPIKPFAFLMFLMLILIPFQTKTPINLQLYSWLRVIVAILFLPVVVWNSGLNEHKYVEVAKNFFIIGVLLSCLYGLALTQTGGINPYLMSYGVHYEDAFSLQYALADSSGRPFGRIQSTFQHPMEWALFLCLAFFIVFIFFLKERRKRYLVLLVLIGGNVLINGVRTGILTIGLIMFIYVFSTKNIRVMSTSVVCLLGLVIALSIVSGEFYDYVTSILQVSGKADSVSGSSLGLRISQLRGSIQEIEGMELVGKGYGWTQFYQSANGDHPVILAFESLLFVIICNSGLIGIMSWVVFVAMFYINHFNNYSKENRNLLNLFVLTYLIFAGVTGEYDYLQIFVIYYTLIAVYLKKQHFDEEQSKSHCVLPASVPSNS